jgi:hypothetical protein
MAIPFKSSLPSCNLRSNLTTTTLLTPTWGGSLPGKAANKKRDFVGAYETLKKQYFSGVASVYNETDFERRFRVPRTVFMKLHDKLMGMEP